MQVIWKKQWKFIHLIFFTVIFVNLKFSTASNKSTTFLNSEVLKLNYSSQDFKIWPIEIVKTKIPIKRIKRSIGPPRNLTGFVFWDDSFNIFRLKLTWKPPINMSKSYGYNLTYFCDPRPCKSGFYIEADVLLKDKKSTTIPTVEEKDFISLNSTIHIILTTLPYSLKEDNSITLIYKVPDCVDSRCYCGHMNHLPKPNIQASFTYNEKVNVSWSTPYKILEKNDSRYHTIHVYISVYHKQKQKYVHNEIVTLKLKDINAEHYSILSPNLPQSKDYTVFLHLRDNEGCTTLNASTHILVFNSEYLSNTSLFYAVVIIFTASLILFCTVISIRQHVKKWLKFVCVEKSQSNKRASIDLNTTSSEGYFRLTKLNSTTIPLKKSEVYIDHKDEDLDCSEISFNKLVILNQIGRGEFGLVYRAYINQSDKNNDNLVVAVKTLKDFATPEERNDFVKEITMFKNLGYHPNIVKLIGYCTIQEPYCMVMEYLANGDLATYLRKLKENWRVAQNKYPTRFHLNKANHFNFSRTDIDKIVKYSTGSISSTFTLDSSITTSMATSRSGRPSATETEYILLSSDGSLLLTPNSANDSPAILESVVDSIELQKFALQIAQGMAYLEQKDVTHRDLAARNILIDEYKNLKISDFGLSRSGTYICTKSKLPYRWLSIEALRDQIFTNKSDVWSFGIVLWEIGTLGDFPYSSMENYMQILKYLIEGNRLEKPISLSDDIYNLMLRCWAEKPDDRPTFAEITNDLNMMSDKKLYITFDSSKIDIEI